MRPLSCTTLCTGSILLHEPETFISLLLGIVLEVPMLSVLFQRPMMQHGCIISQGLYAAFKLQ